MILFLRLRLPLQREHSWRRIKSLALSEGYIGCRRTLLVSGEGGKKEDHRHVYRTESAAAIRNGQIPVFFVLPRTFRKLWDKHRR